MKHFFTVIVFVFALLLGACNNNSTNPQQTTGEIYGETKLYNEYRVLLTDQSGITVQLLEQGNVKQTIFTATDGIFSFKNVPAGVYDLRFFKQGYVWGDGITDSLVAKNVQFVGNGRFLVDEYNHGYRYFDFYSIIEPDSAYWALKPDIEYEVIKDIKPIDNVWIKDTIAIDKGGHDVYVHVYGSGTKETQKIRFKVNCERALPFAEMDRSLSLQIESPGSKKNFSIPIDKNTLSGEYEYVNPNVIIRDSLGTVVMKSYAGSSYTIIQVKEITVLASSSIPNDIRKSSNIPRRISKTNELKLSLTD